MRRAGRGKTNKNAGYFYGLAISINDKRTACASAAIGSTTSGIGRIKETKRCS